MSTPVDKISKLLHSMQSCISDIKPLTTANMLKLNVNKAELMLVTSRRTKHLHSLSTSVTVGNSLILLRQSVKKFGFTLDCHLNIIARIFIIPRARHKNWTVILISLHVSSLFLLHAPSNCIVRHLLVVSKKILQLPLLYLPLFCKKLSIATHSSLALLMM